MVYLILLQKGGGSVDIYGCIFLASQLEKIRSETKFEI